jgi:hypothetical protein
MEDLLAKFYGKSESEGSSGASGPDESAPGLESEQRLEHGQQLAQRVGLVESQLLQMAKAQQTILARLDTMIEQQDSQPAAPQSPPPTPKHPQEPPPAPQQAWRPAWKEPRPEPQPKPDESIGEGEGTPLSWDPINKTLHTMDDASDDGPSQQERSEDQRRSSHDPKRTCTICGRQFSMKMGKMARASKHGPETLHCPNCYERYRGRRQISIICFVAFVVILVLVWIFAEVAENRQKARRREKIDITIPMPVSHDMPDPFRKRR